MEGMKKLKESKKDSKGIEKVILKIENIKQKLEKAREELKNVEKALPNSKEQLVNLEFYEFADDPKEEAKPLMAIKQTHEEMYNGTIK